MKIAAAYCRTGLPALLLAVAALLSAPVALADPAGALVIAKERCSACHGEDGNSVVPGFPKLAGQQASYLLREMKDYLAGKRSSEIMQPALANLTEGELEGLAHHFAAQAPSAGEVTRPELLPLGKRIYLEGNAGNGVPACSGCHEDNGAGVGKFPRVAGQHAEYALEQLRQYASGQRNNGVRIMRTIAQRLSADESVAVVEYMSSLK